MSSSSKKPSSAIGRAGGSSPKRRSKSPTKPESPGKGKGKVTSASGGARRGREDDEDDEEEDEDDEMDEDDDDDDDDDEEDDDDDMDEDDDEDEEAEETDERINPDAILPGRRTRGIRVDYASREALDRAGLHPEGEDEGAADTR